MNSERNFLSVHDAHCCKIHGCKYGDEDCPVVLGDEEGIYCEDCDHDSLYLKSFLEDDTRREFLYDLIRRYESDGFSAL